MSQITFAIGFFCLAVIFSFAVLLICAIGYNILLSPIWTFLAIGALLVLIGQE